MRRLVLMSLVAAATASHARAAHGPHGMVAAEHRLASQAGIDILRAGGNAVDAAVATSLVLGVVNPTSCGLGGGGFMVVFNHRQRAVHALDYRETAPAAAGRDMFVRDGKVDPSLSLYGGLAVAVPGEVAGLDAALRRFGTMSWSEVAAPAIRHARDGFAVEPHLAEKIAEQQDRIRARPELAALLLRRDGTPLRSGDQLRQPDLAATLERIARDGARAFYEGPVAEAIARSVHVAGGIVDTADLRSYRSKWRTPVNGHLGPYDVHSMPPPSSGGGVLVQVLNTIRGDDLAALQHNSATYLHLLAESMQFAFADRASFYGDPDIVTVPLARLLSSARATRLRHRLSAAATFSPSFYGAGAVPRDDGTAHLSVVDAQGNAVACTTSINTSFGSLVVASGTGIVLNNTMDDFSVQPGVPNVFGLIGSEANAVAPHKRPLSSMTPTIVTRGGEVAAVAGGSGGPFIISGTLQVLLNTLVFGDDAAAAVAAPRVHHQWQPATLMVEPGLGVGVRGALSRLGHRTVEWPEVGAVQLVRRSSTGELDGAADPRKGGQALGW